MQKESLAAAVGVGLLLSVITTVAQEERRPFLHVEEVAVGWEAEGRPQLLAVDARGQLWRQGPHKQEGEWEQEGAGVPALRHAVAVWLPLEGPQLFAVDGQGRLWTRRRQGQERGAAWGAWAHEAEAPAGLRQVARVQGRWPQFLAVDEQGRLWCRQRGGLLPGSPWAPWKRDMQAPAGLRQVAAVRLQGGEPRLFAVDAEGQLWTRGERWERDLEVAPALRQVVVAEDSEGRPLLFALDTSGRLWTRGQERGGPHEVWTDWQVDGEAPPMLKQVAVEPEGGLRLFAVDWQGRLWSRSSAQPGQEPSWVPWGLAPTKAAAVAALTP